MLALQTPPLCRGQAELWTPFLRWKFLPVHLSPISVRLMQTQFWILPSFFPYQIMIKLYWTTHWDIHIQTSAQFIVSSVSIFGHLSLTWMHYTHTQFANYPDEMTLVELGGAPLTQLHRYSIPFLKIRLDDSKKCIETDCERKRDPELYDTEGRSLFDTSNSDSVCVYQFLCVNKIVCVSVWSSRWKSTTCTVSLQVLFNNVDVPH